MKVRKKQAIASMQADDLTPHAAADFNLIRINCAKPWNGIRPDILRRRRKLFWRCGFFPWQWMCMLYSTYVSTTYVWVHTRASYTHWIHIYFNGVRLEPQTFIVFPHIQYKNVINLYVYHDLVRKKFFNRVPENPIFCPPPKKNVYSVLDTH